MDRRNLIGEIVSNLVNISITELALLNKLIQKLSLDTSGKFAGRLLKELTARPPVQATQPTPPVKISAEEQRQLEQTIETHEEIFKSLPNDINSLEILKEAYRKLGRLEEELYARERLARAFENAGRKSEAILERAAIIQITENATSPTSQPEIETDLRKRDELEQQVKMFEVIVADVPNDYQSLEILRNAYAKLGRTEDALRIWRRIVDAYLGLGNLTNAKAEAERILTQHPSDPTTLTLLTEINHSISPS